MTEPGTDRRVSLGSWPTPVEPAPRALGLGAGDLWVKRDDLTGLGGGGNKVRKLEWTCGRALADGATVLVTTGGRRQVPDTPWHPSAPWAAPTASGHPRAAREG